VVVKRHLPIVYGNEFAKCFYLKEAPSLLMRPLSRSQLAITRLTLENGLPEPTARVYPEKAFTISVHLTNPDFRGWGTWVGGKFVSVNSWIAGGIGIYDLESDPIAVRGSAFDSIHYNLPRTTLDAFTDDSEMPNVDTLVCTQGTRDEVLHHLTQMILPSLGPSKNRFPDLFFDHFVLMFCGRVVNAYRSSGSMPRLYQGGLAPWQKRRILELLEQHLDGDLRLSRLAGECGLSISHFARSFKKSFGVSVHRYLIAQRVETAKELLLHSRKTLPEIALQTGFSDQAAFSRTFGAVVGKTARRWQNEYGHRLRLPGGTGHAPDVDAADELFGSQG
jgi:AraC family transcriptional regulator